MCVRVVEPCHSSNGFGLDRGNFHNKKVLNLKNQAGHRASQQAAAPEPVGR